MPFLKVPRLTVRVSRKSGSRSAVLPLDLAVLQVRVDAFDEGVVRVTGGEGQLAQRAAPGIILLSLHPQLQTRRHLITIHSVTIYKHKDMESKTESECLQREPATHVDGRPGLGVVRAQVGGQVAGERRRALGGGGEGGAGRGFPG